MNSLSKNPDYPLIWRYDLARKYFSKEWHSKDFFSKEFFFQGIFLQGIFFQGIFFPRNSFSKEFFKIFIGFCLSQKHHIYRFKFFPVNMRLIRWKRKIILHEIDSSFFKSWKRKIILREMLLWLLIMRKSSLIMKKND